MKNKESRVRILYVWGRGVVLLDRVVKNCLISLPLSCGLKKVRTNALWMSGRAVVQAERLVNPKR